MRIQLIQADITQVNSDAIVNAANSSLLGGGDKILDECREIRARQGKYSTGEAVITTAGDLPAKFVIHTVGPVWNDGSQNEIELLKSCYQNSLALAEKYQLESIAFPNISTGIYHFPKDLAAQIAIKAVQEWNYTSLKQCTFVCFDEENFTLYQNIL